METKVQKFNPYAEGFTARPYEQYAALRENDPVHWSFVQCWFVARYADVTAVLKDHRRFESSPIVPHRVGRNGGREDEIWSVQKCWMMSLNPPAHARVRSLVSRSFAPQVVDQLRAKVARAATTLLEENCGGDVVDFVRDFAVPLPIRLMLELFGVSPEHMTKLKEWSTAIGRTLETVIDRDIMERANAATESFAALLKDLIEQRRDGAGDDMLSLLMRKDDTGAALSDDEVIANAILIFSAGHETTTNALANTLYLLTRQPELLATLRTTPALRRSALEECLRHESPVQMLARRAKEDVVVGDKTIRAGQRVVVLLGSANRDPAQFDAPDEVRLDRSPNAHIAFGQGIHYCLGSPMARLELEVALNLLIERTADIRLESDDIEWNDNVALRGPRALRLAMTFR